MQDSVELQTECHTAKANSAGNRVKELEHGKDTLDGREGFVHQYCRRMLVKQCLVNSGEDDVMRRRAGWLLAALDAGSRTVALMRDRGFAHPHGSAVVLALEGLVTAAWWS